MKKKISHLLENAQVAVLDLCERNYNSKVSSKPTVGMLVASAKERLTFDNFLQADEDFTLFDATPPIDWY